MTTTRILSACLLAAAMSSAVNAAEQKPKFASDVVRHGDIAVEADITGAKKLILMVGDGGDGFTADWADWIDPVLVGPAGTVKLTDLTWVSATTGWGSAHLHQNVSGGEMKVDGKPVDGIGVHAISMLVYNIAGKGFTKFKARGGVDNGGTEQNGGSSTSVQFFVYTDKIPKATGSSPNRDLPPDESVAAMTTADGLETTLWASEPMFSNPTDIDIDAKGRVWVDEGNNYRQWQHNIPAGDRIVVMEDSKGSGKADKIRVFYQGNDVNAALGMCVLGNRILVSDSPDVFSFTDNGEGKPPTKELLFTGIDGHQHDHGMHTFVFGPDGKLYFNFGNEGHQIRDKNGQKIIDLEGNEVNNSSHPYRQGMTFRCNPDGSQFEVLGWNFRNDYEVNVDSFGTIFQSDNDDDGNRATRINYVMEHGNYGYVDEITSKGWNEGPSMLPYITDHPTEEDRHLDTVARHWHQYDPGVMPNLLNTGAGSPTGILVYEGDLLPALFRNQLIHCEPGSNVVRSYALTNSGAGYSATINNILQSKDSWFRPSDCCIAPDGALFVADWFDPGVGGHQMGDHDPNTAGGRLYRVAPPGNVAKVPAIDLTTASGAVKALCSPNLSTRYLAWTALHAMGAAAEPALLTLWKNDNARMRARALWLLTKIPDKGEAYVLKASTDANSDIRITALRAARQIAGYDVIPLVTSLVHDPSPQVRRECLITLRHNPSEKMPELWSTLAQQQDGTDRWYIEALGIAADKRENDCFNAWKSAVKEDWRSPGGREVVWRSRANGVAALLAQLILEPADSALDRERYFRALDFQPADEREIALVSLLLAGGTSGEKIQESALSRIKNLDSPQTKAALATILEKSKGTPAFVALIKRFKITDHDDDLLAYAIAHKDDSSAAEAMKLVLDHNDIAAVTKALHGVDAAATATVLGDANDPRSCDLLQPLASDAALTLAVRQEAIRALGKTEPGAQFLLKNQQEHTWSEDTKSLVSSVLFNAPWDSIRSVVNKGQAIPLTKDGKPLPSFTELAKIRGDAKHGQVLFSSQFICTTCHQVNGVGTDFGPNLSEIGTKLGKDAIYEAIVFPDAGIEFNFETTELKLVKDDQVVLGIVVSDTPDEVAIKVMGGKIWHYKTSEIASRTKKKNSMMLPNLQMLGTQQDLVDLVEFLSSLKKK